MRSIKILPLLALFCPSVSHAQIHIGQDIDPRLKEFTELSVKQLDRLRGTTTIFFYSEAEEPYLDRMRAALDTLWTVSKLELRPMHEQDATMKEEVSDGSRSYLTVVIETITRDGRLSTFNPYLSLWMVEEVKGKKRRMQLAGIVLDPKREWLNKEIGRRGSGGAMPLNNWSPGLLVCYLAGMNELLLGRKSRGYISDEVTTTALKRLKKDTLYVLDGVLEDYRVMSPTGAEKHDPNELLKDYPKPWRIVSPKEFDRLFFERGARMLYLISAKLSGARFITIYDSANGAMVYGGFNGWKYNVKPSDFKDIGVAVIGGK